MITAALFCHAHALAFGGVQVTPELELQDCDDDDLQPKEAVPEAVKSIDLGKYPFVVIQMESSYTL